MAAKTSGGRRFYRANRPFWRQAVSLSLLATLTGCADLAYYRQAATGQWALLHASRPVTEIIHDPTTSPMLRQRLQRAQALRVFASAELALPDNASYQRYATLGRPYVVQNVVAAPELSLEPRRWCFWWIGCLPYRGYFDAAAAQRLAAELRAVGDDVYLAEIPAYSTLGWLADPLLDTFIAWPEGRLAELMFHELAHQRWYLTDDAAFNEALATAVGQLGAQRWLEQHGAATALAEFRTDGQRRQAFLELTTATRAALAELYASSQSAAAKRAEKRRLLAELRMRYQALRREWGGYAGYDRWFAQDLNNAKLASLSTYYRLVPAFEKLFNQQGRDFAAFYRAVESLAAQPPAERAVRLQALLQSADPSMLAREFLAPADKPSP